MPQRDTNHVAVRAALEHDGWIITNDPFYLPFGNRRGFVDLAAAPIAARQQDRTIAVEVKSFIGESVMADLAEAVGQYLIYKSWLKRLDPDRVLYLAIDEETVRDVFGDLSVQVLIEDYEIRLVVVATATERIVAWTS
jgi:hypothetical protein